MNDRSQSGGRTRRPGVLLLARAVCKFDDGEEARLYTTELSLGGGFILSMKPPQVGTVLSVILYPAGFSPLPPIGARVIGLRVDPAKAEQTGFEVVFPDLDYEFAKKLGSVLKEVRKPREAPQRERERDGAERRRYPRVEVEMFAHVELPNGDTEGSEVDNLSMSGAKLTLDHAPEEIGLSAGIVLTMSLVAPNTPEAVAVKAKVVRMSNPREPRGLGICFVETDPVTERRIEGLILHTIAGDCSWYLRETA